jgi:hypothetical protein
VYEGLKNEFEAVQTANKFVHAAMIRQSAAWKTLVPLAKKLAGPQSADTLVAPVHVRCGAVPESGA